MVGEPVDAYLLYVNQQQVPEIFETLEEAQVAIRQRFRSRQPGDWYAIGIINMI